MRLGWFSPAPVPVRHVHDWGKWSDPAYVEWRYKGWPNGEEYTGTKYTQERRCSECNYTERHDIL